MGVGHPPLWRMSIKAVSKEWNQVTQEQPIKQEVTDLGHIKSVFYRFKHLKMNVDYIIPLIYRQPTSDCMVAYLLRPRFWSFHVRPVQYMPQSSLGARILGGKDTNLGRKVEVKYMNVPNNAWISNPHNHYPIGTLTRLCSTCTKVQWTPLLPYAI